VTGYVNSGFVSADCARNLYKVVIRSDLSLDVEATKRLRRA